MSDTIERFWPADGAKHLAIDLGNSAVEALFDKIDTLAPQNDVQRALRSQAETMALDALAQLGR